MVQSIQEVHEYALEAVRARLRAKARHGPGLATPIEGPVVTLIACALGVSSDWLTGDDLLIDIVRVSREDLGITPADWERFGLQADHIQPAVYDLWESILAACDRKKWKEFHQRLESPPRTEDEGVDFLLGMTVRKAVETFTPLLRQSPRE